MENASSSPAAALVRRLAGLVVLAGVLAFLALSGLGEFLIGRVLATYQIKLLDAQSFLTGCF